MRLCFFDDYRLGVVDNDAIRDVSEVLDEIAPQRYPFARDDAFIARLPQLMPKIAAAAEGKPAIAPTRVRLRSPVPNPGKLIAAPVNYQAHLDEAIADPGTFARAHVRRIQETGLFLKATSALAGAGDGIVLSHPGRRSDHEIELAAVIGRRCKNVSKAEALGCVAGYCIGLDITIRGPEERSLRKSPDSYAVLGPWLVTADELGPPSGTPIVAVGQWRGTPARQHGRSDPRRRRADRIRIKLLHPRGGRRRLYRDARRRGPDQAGRRDRRAHRPHRRNDAWSARMTLPLHDSWLV